MLVEKQSDVCFCCFFCIGLFELHGNSNVEKCAKCKHEYLRDYRVSGRGIVNHETGIHCVLHMNSRVWLLW